MAKKANPIDKAGGKRLTSQEDIRQEITAQVYSGPLPLPEQFAQYENTLPGAADRILKMAEREQDARITYQQSESRRKDDCPSLHFYYLF